MDINFPWYLLEKQLWYKFYLLVKYIACNRKISSLNTYPATLLLESTTDAIITSKCAVNLRNSFPRISRESVTRGIFSPFIHLSVLWPPRLVVRRLLGSEKEFSIISCQKLSRTVSSVPYTNFGGIGKRAASLGIDISRRYTHRRALLVVGIHASCNPTLTMWQTPRSLRLFRAVQDRYIIGVPAGCQDTILVSIFE